MIPIHAPMTGGVAVEAGPLRHHGYLLTSFPSPPDMYLQLWEMTSTYHSHHAPVKALEDPLSAGSIATGGLPSGVEVHAWESSSGDYM